MKPIISQLKQLYVQVDRAIDQLDIARDQARLTELETTINQPDFWSDRMQAEQISVESANLHRHIEHWRDLQTDLATTLELAELETSEGQAAEYQQNLQQLQKRVDQAMIELKLSGEFDNNTAIIQLSAGVGGTDAQDWAQILMNMYVKYANSQGWRVEVVETSAGEEAGIKSATLEISGQYAYGKLKGEKGVHRLVRLSPFNADNLRQTSFALVDVVPELTQSEVALDDKDLKIDTYRSSGHGGQSVNTTDSAVRITHLPTGLVVAIQNERSQLKNKQKALSILTAKLADVARQAHMADINQLRGQLKSADWGAQIRSYVMQPYTKVKDHRTGFETADVTGVLDGKLTGFVESYLDWQISQSNKHNK